MKRTVVTLVLLLAVAAFSRADDGQDSEKDWCLLGNVNKCPAGTAMDLFEKIRRLESAIQKGGSVYTPEELERLRKMLAEAYETKGLVERY